MPSTEVLIPYTVLLIDPHEITRAGLRALMSEDVRFEVIGDTARDGVALAQRLRPTLILIDPMDHGQFDMKLVAALAAAVPESRICVHTSFFDSKRILRALEVGALGYFLRAS